MVEEQIIVSKEEYDSYLKLKKSFSKELEKATKNSNWFFFTVGAATGAIIFLVAYLIIG